jgi:hypothetical protein
MALGSVMCTKVSTFEEDKIYNEKEILEIICCSSYGDEPHPYAVTYPSGGK